MLTVLRLDGCDAKAEIQANSLVPRTGPDCSSLAHKLRCRASDRQNPTVPDMPELTIGRMAKLYGLHRSTLYEAVSKGRVTAGFNAKGQRVIDLSEMIRVYGEPPSNARHPTPLPDIQPDSDQTALINELRRQTAVIERMAERIEKLEATMLALPAPPQPAKGTHEPTAPEIGEKPVKGFDDILARLNARRQQH